MCLKTCFRNRPTKSGFWASSRSCCSSSFSALRRRSASSLDLAYGKAPRTYLVEQNHGAPKFDVSFGFWSLIRFFSHGLLRFFQQLLLSPLAASLCHLDGRHPGGRLGVAVLVAVLVPSRKIEKNKNRQNLLSLYPNRSEGLLRVQLQVLDLDT